MMTLGNQGLKKYIGLVSVICGSLIISLPAIAQINSDTNTPKPSTENPARTVPNTSSDENNSNPLCSINGEVGKPGNSATNRNNSSSTTPTNPPSTSISMSTPEDMARECGVNPNEESPMNPTNPSNRMPPTNPNTQPSPGSIR